MASNVLLLTVLGGVCVCSLSCMSSLIFIRHQRALAKDVLETGAKLAENEAAINKLNADTPPPVPKADPVLAKPQDMTPKTGAFRVPWWKGCLVLEKDKIGYKEGDESKCDTSLVRVPVSPFMVAYPDRVLVNDAFVIKSGERYVGSNFNFVAEDKAVRLRRDPASGTIEVVSDENNANMKPSSTRPCWNIQSKKLYLEKDRNKYKTCARWEIP